MKVCSWKEKLFSSLSDPSELPKFLTTLENEGGVLVSVVCVAAVGSFSFISPSCVLCVFVLLRSSPFPVSLSGSQPRSARVIAGSPQLIRVGHPGSRDLTAVAGLLIC